MSGEKRREYLRRRNERAVLPDRIITVRHCEAMHAALTPVSFLMNQRELILRPTVNQACCQIIYDYLQNDEKYLSAFIQQIHKRSDGTIERCKARCPYYKKCSELAIITPSALLAEPDDLLA